MQAGWMDSLTLASFNFVSLPDVTEWHLRLEEQAVTADFSLSGRALLLDVDRDGPERSRLNNRFRFTS